jgi:hypothetical protein
MSKIFLATALTFALSGAAFAQSMAPAQNTMMAPHAMKSDLDKHKKKALPANSMAPHGPTTPTTGANPMKGNLAKPQ